MLTAALWRYLKLVINFFIERRRKRTAYTPSLRLIAVDNNELRLQLYREAYIIRNVLHPS